MLDPVTNTETPGLEAYGTPAAIIEAVHTLMGGIDLDPATDALFNTNVRASRIFTKEDNGLDQAWSGRVFLNPPGGKAKPRANAWWRRLVDQYLAGEVTEAVYISFALDSLQWSQAKGSLPILTFPTAVFAKRVKFLRQEGGALVGTKNPTRPCAITWLPPAALSPEEQRECFDAVIAMLGEFKHSAVAVYP